MRKLLTSLSFIFCCFSKTIAQAPLIADAGPDRYWCQHMAESGADTPRLGGLVAATGGVPPYTFQWSFRTANYPYTGDYLDSFTVAHPLVIRIPTSTGRENTATALLVVRDANGTEARDSVAVFFQRIVGLLGTISKVKGIDDTVRIGGDQTQDQFPPYHNYRWSPTNTLIDSTEKNPLCFARTSTIYSASYVDSVGCFLCCGQVIVEIRPTGITPAYSSSAQAIAFISIDKQLTVHLPEAKKGKIRLYSLNGKKLLEQTLNEQQTRIPLPELPAGMFLYKITTDEGGRYSGKLSPSCE